MTTSILKKCSKCKKEQNFNNFPKVNENRRNSYCKNCHNEISKEWTINNREMKRAQTRKSKKIGRETNADWLIKNSLLSNKKFSISYSIIPQELVDTKRLQLALHRLIKEKSSQQSQSV